MVESSNLLIQDLLMILIFIKDKADLVRRSSPGKEDLSINGKLAYAKASASEGGEGGIRTHGTV